MVKCLPGIRLNVAICRPCHAAGAIPIWVAVQESARMNPTERSAPWWEWTIHDTLEHLGVARDEFERLVRQHGGELSAAS